LDGDGRHISYLHAPKKWRHFDPDLFDALKQVVKSGPRTVAALEDPNLLPGSVYFSEVTPAGRTPKETEALRQQYFARCQKQLIACNLVFLDPDNGFETKNFSLGCKNGAKSVSLKALAALRQAGRTLVVYHHHTHRTGGHVDELQYWADRLRAQVSNESTLSEPARTRPGRSSCLMLTTRREVAGRASPKGGRV